MLLGKPLRGAPWWSGRAAGPYGAGRGRPAACARTRWTGSASSPTSSWSWSGCATGCPPRRRTRPARDPDTDFEVTTVSGLDAGLQRRGSSRASPGRRTPGTRTSRWSCSTWPRTAARGFSGERPAPASCWALVTEGRVVGALGVASDRVAGFSDEEAVLLQRIGTAVAGAADCARLRVSERERRGWLTFLAETGDLLAGSLDQDMTMAITGQVVVPRSPPGARSTSTTSATPCPPAGLGTATNGPRRRCGPRWRRRLPRGSAGPGTSGSAQVLGIPLVARGRRIGQLTLGRPPGTCCTGRPAWSRSRWPAARRWRSTTPARTASSRPSVRRSSAACSRRRWPSAPQFDVGVVYEAAGERSLAGGDFYDVFPLGGGRWCFAVGDVCGTGRGSRGHRPGPAHHSGARPRGVPGLRHPRAAQRGDPRGGGAVALHPGLRDALEEGRRWAAPDEPGQRGTPAAVRRTADGRSARSAAPAVAGRHREGDLPGRRVRPRPRRPPGGGDRRRAGAARGAPHARGGGLAADLTEAGNLPAQAVAERIRRLVGDFAPGPQTDDMAVLMIRVTPAG